MPGTRESLTDMVQTIFTAHGLAELKDVQAKLIDTCMVIIDQFSLTARTAGDKEARTENQLTELVEIAEEMKASLGNLGQPDLDSIARFRRWKEERKYGSD